MSSAILLPTQVALAVFEIDWVHLVRHRGAADLTRDNTLPEVAQADVAPAITVEIKQDGVEAGH